LINQNKKGNYDEKIHRKHAGHSADDVRAVTVGWAQMDAAAKLKPITDAHAQAWNTGNMKMHAAQRRQHNFAASIHLSGREDASDGHQSQTTSLNAGGETSAGKYRRQGF
jgi:hypothetical protein